MSAGVVAGAARQPPPDESRSMRFARLSIVAAACALPIVALGACYGATELTIEITTDVPCGEGPTTAVYKGGRRSGGGIGYDEGAIAETQRCAPGDRGNDIGSIVLVPRGARNAEAAVKIVLATGGESVEDCARDPAGKSCIVATRSFSFVEHTSLTIPISLSASCRGVVCGEGETCVAGGRCVGDRVACAGDDCAPPDEREDAGGGDGARDGGPPIPDAGLPDADAGPPLVTTCDPTGEVDLAFLADAPALFAAGAEELFYVDRRARSRLRAIAKGGGAPRVAFPDGAGVVPAKGIVALAARGTSWAIATTSGVHYQTAASGGVLFQELSQIGYVAISPDHAIYAAGSKDSPGPIRRIGASDAVATGHGPIAVDQKALYYIGKSGEARAIFSADAKATEDSGRQLLEIGARLEPWLSSTDDGVLACVTSPLNDDAFQFRKLNPRQPGSPIATVSDVAAFAATADTLFSAPGPKPTLFWREAQPSTTDANELNVAGIKIVALEADDACVYYWVEIPPGTGIGDKPAGFQLRSRPRALAKVP